MASRSEWIQATISSLLEIEKVMSVSFGSNSKAVLIQKPAGQPVITCSGLEILQSLEFDSTFTKVVTCAAQKMHSFLGDGVKTFIFLLLELMQNCNKVLDVCNFTESVHFSRQLQHFADHVLPSVVISGDFLKHCQVKCTQSCMWTDILKLWKTVIKNHLETKFPILVSRVLIECLHEFLSDTCQKESDLVYVLSHFKLLCLEIYQLSVTDSLILDGFVVTQEIAVETESVHKSDKSSFVLWKIAFGSHKNDKDHIVVVQNEEHRLSLLTGGSRQFEKTLDYYKSHFGITLIISKECLLSYMLFLCKKKNISVIHGVMEEEMDYISNVLQMVAVTDLSESLSKNNVESLLSVRKLNLGSHTYVKLQFNKCPNLKQLVICGPTESICKQYSRECLNCIKILTVLDINLSRDVLKSAKKADFQIHPKVSTFVDCTSELCTGVGGDGEVRKAESSCVLENHINPIADTVSVNSNVEHIQDKSNNLAGNLGKKLTFSQDEIIEKCSSHIVTMPCHHFEYVLHHFLSKSDLSFTNNINSLVAETVINIPKRLHALSVRKASARSFILEKFKAIECITRGECCSTDSKCENVESLFIKQTVLETVIRTASMIFRISGEQRVRRIRDMTLHTQQTEDSDSENES